MNLFRFRRKDRKLAGYPVIEAGPDIDHHVAIMHGVIGFKGAMHADHA
jgi:hypothetical protein